LGVDMTYRTNFLTNVVFKIDFDSIPDYSEALLENFRAKVSDDFPEYSVKDLVEHSSTVGSDGVMKSDSTTSKIGLYVNPTLAHKVTLTKSSLSLEVFSYSDFNSFSSKLTTILDKFLNLQPNINDLNRVGLRFVNQISIPKTNPLDWKGFVNSSLIAPINKFFENDTNKIARTVSQTILNYDNYFVNKFFRVINLNDTSLSYEFL
jgi:uncharacterized protein (TIGR04255 family)